VTPSPSSGIALLLAFFAGSFLFTGAVHLLPGARTEAEGPGLYVALEVGFAFAAVAGRIFRM
jgi:hypothetical protein